MFGFLFGSLERRLVMAVAWALLALVVLWLGFREFRSQSAHDFEECVEQVEAKHLSNDERRASMTECNVQFAGRRKAGGGYTYYDFMQDRSFDIAGPNPTAEEHKRIDGEYMAFLDTQRRETISAALAKRQNELLQAELEGVHQPAGPPLVLTPKNPLTPAAKRPADRSKSTRCDDGSLACSWKKFSTAVKNSFASTSKPNP